MSNESRLSRGARNCPIFLPVCLPTLLGLVCLVWGGCAAQRETLIQVRGMTKILDIT